MTTIKVEDVISTLQVLDLIQYKKGQHVICSDPKVLDRHLKVVGIDGWKLMYLSLPGLPTKSNVDDSFSNR
jgi:hypothetical protein